MKSYLRFLSRNKLYTVIEVIGLSIALGFIIILSAYIIDEISTDLQVKNKSKLWVCHNRGIASSSQNPVIVTGVTSCPMVSSAIARNSLLETARSGSK